MRIISVPHQLFGQIMKGQSLFLGSGFTSDFCIFMMSKICTKMVWCRCQREAGEAVGVASGETWRTAFQAAAQNGASQVCQTYQAISQMQIGLQGLNMFVQPHFFLC